MKVIRKGIFSRIDQAYEIRVLDDSFFGQVVQLQNKVIEQLEDPSVLQALTTEEYEHIFSEEGLIIGCFVKEQLIAIRAMIFPPLEEEYLGEHARIPVDERHLIMYQEISFVDPDYTGNGIQQLLAEVIVEQVDQTRVRYMCATVQPTNIPSLLDKFRQGFVATAMGEIYPDKLRFVFVKDVRQSYAFTETFSCKMSDLFTVEEALAKGFVVYDLQQEEGAWQFRLGLLQ